MSSKESKKSDAPGSNYQEPQPKGTVPEGDHVVKQPKDKLYVKQSSDSTYPDPSKYKENSEQPVYPIKSPPNEENQ